MIVDSKGELPVAVPHVSDEEDDGKPFGGSALREQKAISFSINVRHRTCTASYELRYNYEWHFPSIIQCNLIMCRSHFRQTKTLFPSFTLQNTMVRPAVRSDAGMAKEFPVSSGSQHRKKVRIQPQFQKSWNAVSNVKMMINSNV